MITPVDYDSIFNDHLVVITGTSRSGTSIIERLVGSMQDCFSVFEPVSLPMILTLIEQEQLAVDEGKTLLQSILFEDLFLQRLHGRNLNFNRLDQTYYENYETLEDVKTCWSDFRSRKDVLSWLSVNRYHLIVKNPNLQPLLQLIDGLFLGVKFIIVYRKSDDTVGSNIRKGFFNDQDITGGMAGYWCEQFFKNVDDDTFCTPWFIDTDKNDFKNLTHGDRCMLIFDTLKKYEEEFVLGKDSDNLLLVDFEKFKDNPEFYVRRVEKFLWTHRTQATSYVLWNVDKYEQREYKKLKTRC